MLNVDRRLLESRLHLSTSQLGFIDSAAVDVARDIYGPRGRVVPEQLSNARSVIEHFGFDFARVRQPRYVKFRQALTLPQDAALAAAAAMAWCHGWWKGQLSADPPARLVPLLEFLKAAEVTADWSEDT